ncbi:hypothetical protein GCM10023197_46040 [Gordonia humi]
MAGRPKKHQDGLVRRNMWVDPDVEAAFKRGAQKHGLTLVDYFAALVLQAESQPITPAQEVLPLRLTG